jgi:L-alanine-DL-glutamate epimerase-like enolase superfamily enzyme
LAAFTINIAESNFRHTHPLLIGRDADDIEMTWRDLFYRVHATTVGALTSIALAAIDTALWDLRAKRAKLPMHKLAGGAKDRIRLYYTEGGWLHIDEGQLVEEALQAKESGFGGTKIKVGRPHVAEDVRRLRAVRNAVGDEWDVMTDANQSFMVDEAIRRARHSMPTTCWLTIIAAGWSSFRSSIL